MTDAKPWYFSRTIWASLVTVFLSVAGLAGLSVDGIDNSLLTDTVLQTVTAVCGLVAIFGRLTARDRIE